MNDHNHLLILGGVVVVLAPFVLIGIGIASDYRAAHPKKPYQPHHARNIVLGFALATVASVVFARALTSSRRHRRSLLRRRIARLPGCRSCQCPRPWRRCSSAASPGTSAATSPRSTTTRSPVPGSVLMTAFRSAVATGTTGTTSPTAPPVAATEAATTKPPTTTATTKSTVATTTTTRGATTTATMLPPLTTTSTIATTTTTTTTTRGATTTTTIGPPMTITVVTKTINVATKTIVPLLDSVP